MIFKYIHKYVIYMLYIDVIIFLIISRYILYIIYIYLYESQIYTYVLNLTKYLIFQIRNLQEKIK